jgi:hypothetical protein
MTLVRYNVPMPAQVGKPNTNGQALVQKTQEPGHNYGLAKVWILRRPKHGPCRANSCDFHLRQCPRETGKPELV